jgi:hypothetical protein
MLKINRWRTGLIILTAAIAILGIPSLPQHRYHLAYWSAALAFEVVLIAMLWRRNED